MSGAARQLRVSLLLYFRNRMAMIYGYVFPTIFLVAFWVLYRYDRVPIAGHLGELLTVTALGGACFGLPTTIVSERERGVWRRYRLAPIATGTLVTSAVLARYVILLSAGLLQVGLAMAIGMPLPAHPVHLLVAFTFVSFAFMGLGLVIAAMADTVPAVQALGQCIFLPMLIIGGVAVQLASLPDWALHLSAFFPGRYAVQAIQACVSGPGLAAGGFSLLALSLIGLGGCIGGARMFRWDAQQRFSARRGKGWLAVTLGTWACVGLLAEAQGRIQPPPAGRSTGAPAPAMSASSAVPTAAPLPQVPVAGPAPTSNQATTVAPTSRPETASPPPGSPSAAPLTPTEAGRSVGSATTTPGSASASGSQTARVSSAAESGRSATSPPAGPPAGEPATWRAITPKYIDDTLTFEHLPPDSGVVTPIASLDQDPDPDIAADLDTLSKALPSWAPGKVADPVQRVRNLLFVASAVDVLQQPTEPFLPHIVFDEIQRQMPADDLVKILCWIAVHPDEGDESAMDQLQPLGVKSGGFNPEDVRGRSGVYAVKLLGRLLGKIQQR